MIFHNLVPNPETCYAHLWNKSGPNLEAMGIMVGELAERIDIDNYAGTEPDLMQCDISKEFHEAILSEGDTWEE